MEYTQLVKDIVKLLGGEDNIRNAFHCITRLRFECKNEALVDIGSIERLNGVMGVNYAKPQYQIIIGNDVGNCFDTLVKTFPKLQKKEMLQDTKKAKNPILRFINVVSEVFVQFIPALAGAGMIKAIMSIVSIYSLLPSDSSTYIILNAMGDGLFYFLPFFIAISAAKKFTMSPYVAIAITAAILHPSITTLLGSKEAIDFFGLPVQSLSYSQTMIHPLMAIFIAAQISKITEKYVPSMIRMFASPMLIIGISVPLTLIVIGPVAQQIAIFMGNIVAFLTGTGIVGGILLGALMPLLVLTGMHGTTYPITVNSITVNGYDFLWPFKNLVNMSHCGAALGVVARTKNKQFRGVALSTGATAFIGICEPAMFGVNVRLKKPFIAVIIANAIGGAIMGMFNVTCNILPTTGGVFGFLYYVGPTFVYGMIAIAATIVSAFLITYFLGFDDVPEIEKNPKGEEFHTLKSEVVKAPVKGMLRNIETSKDSVFASKTMGDGFYIEPIDNVIYAPVDGIVESVFPTKHAMTIRSKCGAEILLHLGINTVELKEDAYHLFVKEGDYIVENQKIGEMNIDIIQQAGYTSDVIMMICNSSSYKDYHIVKEMNVEAGYPVMELSYEK